MRAIVHIGTEKTGTTSIQEYLYLNRKELKKAGFHLVQSAGKGNNWMLPAFCSKDAQFNEFFRAEGIDTPEDKVKFRQKFVKRFEEEIRSASANIHTFIISSEHLHSRTRSETEVDNVYKLLTAYFDEIKIVCYLREQVSTCASYYSTHLKGGGTDSFAQFLQRCQPGNYYFNYYEVLANWERCFGFESLDVSLFSNDRFLNGDLLDDFTAKLDPALVGTLNKTIQVANESLKPAGQALARAVNILFPVNSERAEIHDTRNKLKTIIKQRLTGKGQQPGQGARKSVYNSFIDTNEQLRQKFFPEVELLFAPPLEVSSPVNVIDEADFENVFSILSLISKSGKGTIFTGDHAQVCTTIFSCINDVTKPIDDTKGAGVEVMLNEADARLLKRAALRIEGTNLQEAYELMALAEKAGPYVPGIKSTLERYRQRGDEAPKPRYTITYYGTPNPPGQEEPQQWGEEFDIWIRTLDIPAGPLLYPFIDTNTISSQGIVEVANRSSVLGFTIFHADSFEEAVAIVQKCPLLKTGVVLEVSAIADMMKILGAQRVASVCPE